MIMNNLDFDYKRIKVRNKKRKLNILKYGKNDNKSLFIKDLNINYLLDDHINNLKSNKNNIYTKESNKIILKYYKKIIKNDSRVVIDENTCNYFMVNELDFLLTAYYIKDINERYKYIYDYICKELDNDFIEMNLCDFVDNKCISRRELEKKGCKNPLIYGCCYTNKKVCTNLINSKCTIKCISCKLFTCRYLVKRKIKYKISDFLAFKLFFNFKQKDLIYNKLFTDEKEYLDLLIKKK